MKKVNAFLRSRGALLAFVVLALGGTLGVLAPADPAQSAICAFRPVLRSYYAEPAHINLVGQRGNDCSCNGVFWGVTSSYVVSETLCCSVNSC